MQGTRGVLHASCGYLIHADVRPALRAWLCCLLAAEFQGSPGATLHLYTTGDPWTTLTAHRNPDDTYSGTFSLKTGGFAGLHTQDDYEQLISANFSGFPAEWVPAVAQQALKESPSPAGAGDGRAAAAAAWAGMHCM